MDSEQEAILNGLSRYSIGSPFVFYPEKFKKGDSIREPADLVWVVNNVVVLIYMTKRSYRENTSTETIQQRKNRLIEHNLNQAEGWLNAWRKGQKLSGKNEYQEFSVSHDDNKHVIVLSVIDYGHEQGDYHQDFSERLNIDLCATISQHAFEHMIKIGCTLVDVVDLLLMIREHDKVEPGSSFIDFVKSFHHVAVNKADPDGKIFRREGNLIYRQTERYLRGFRSMYQSSSGKDHSTALELASILNDLGFEDFIRLNVVLTSLIERWEMDNGYCAVCQLFVKKYTVLLGITASQNLYLSGPKMVEALSKMKSDSGVISILYDGTMQVPLLAFYPRKNQSHLEAMLSTSAN
jgi:hypothetical protein